MAHTIAVVGGSNVDIAAVSHAALIPADSNPGRVRLELGGVGRNIAENLARLGENVRLLTALGDDAFAELLTKQARQIGIDLTDSLTIPGAASSSYVYINGPEGDLALAVNDMAICELLTPDYISGKLGSLNAADAVIVDANLGADAIDRLARGCEAPLYAEAVSVKKAGRLLGALPYLAGLKANRPELAALTGQTIASEGDIRRGAEMLHALGVKRVIVTMGAEGAFASDGTRALFLPSAVDAIVNTNGCGDALIASAVRALTETDDIAEALRRGLAAAAVCARSERAVSEEISPEALLPYLKRLQG